jgi:hypothetical protein
MIHCYAIEDALRIFGFLKEGEVVSYLTFLAV